MRRFRVGAWGLVGLLGLLSLAAPAWAHKQVVRRTIFLEPVESSELHVLVRLEVPSGPPSTALALPFDLDRSGALDETEEARLARHLTERALSGLVLRVDGRVQKLGAVQTELKRGKKGGLELMLHGRVEAGREPIAVELETEATAEPAEVLLLGGARRIRSGFGARQPDGGFRGRLGPASRIRFELAGS